ncbi:MAG: hypothetical protein JW943_06685 [Deltaproteobacteria bacterium]|nr:hypothetical protein [Deltaproteobacteria bacterium]
MTAMESTAPLLIRTYDEINHNRRRLLHEAYHAYPEYIYCEPEEFNWHQSRGRTNIFDLYYLYDAGYIDLTRGLYEEHRRPDFFMLTPAGADLMEKPGFLDEKFPVSAAALNNRSCHETQ